MIVSILCGLLVLAGIVGECIFGMRLSQLSEQLQRKADTEVETSRSAAATAGERAAKAGEAADRLRENAQALKLEIARTNERTARAERQAEQEHSARIELEAKLAPRHLNIAQAKDLTRRLRLIGNTDLDVLVYGDSREIKEVSGQILHALDEARWNARAWPVLPNGTDVYGIQIMVRSRADTTANTVANALVEALEAEGLVVIRRTDIFSNRAPGLLNGPVPWDERKVAAVRMLVGDKP